MSETRDPAIKLFGKTIQLPTCGEARGGVVIDEEKDVLTKEACAASVDMNEESVVPEEKDELPTASTDHDISKSDEEAAVTKDSKGEESNSEKTLKKPDKILPCPRCKSLETKFCYYNNYNVNQPRHFCKNCQRYWTAGGTMRNVPVGAGRRKNKSTASHYRDLNMSNIPQSIIHHPPLKPNGTVLNFSSDRPICESMASVRNLAEQNANTNAHNGFHRGEEKIIPFACGVENGDEQSSVSSATPNQGIDGAMHEPTMQNSHRVPAPIPCFNAPPWPYPWSPAHAFCASSFSIPLYPATAYWGCAVPGNWNMNMPWLSPMPSPSPNSDSSGSAPNSPSLGKHSREGDVLNHRNAEKGDDSEHNRQEKRLWAPKTLRIDNPDEAAMSSIWSTIGIKHDKADEASGRRLFKAFHPKAETKDHRPEASQGMHANPAARSRSLSFQETR